MCVAEVFFRGGLNEGVAKEEGVEGVGKERVICDCFVLFGVRDEAVHYIAWFWARFRGTSACEVAGYGGRFSGGDAEKREDTAWISGDGSPA